MAAKIFFSWIRGVCGPYKAQKREVPTKRAQKKIARVWPLGLVFNRKNPPRRVVEVRPSALLFLFDCLHRGTGPSCPSPIRSHSTIQSSQFGLRCCPHAAAARPNPSKILSQYFFALHIIEGSVPSRFRNRR